MTQTKFCLHCSGSFEITQSDVDFYNKVSPTFAGEKFQIPTPTLCPDCRQRRRLSFRNERRLYKRKCDASGKDIISIYAPGSDYIVYDQKIRRSDDRDPMKYGRDFDFSRSFTEQFGELMRVVPLASQFNTESNNSEYNNHAGYLKDCYLCSGTWNANQSMYCSKSFELESCIDLLNATQSQFCYQCININGCYGSSYLIDCDNCSNSSFLISCNNCSNCYGCNNISNKSYYIFNKEYSKEEYLNEIKKFVMNNWKFWEKFNHDALLLRSNLILRSQNCTGHKISDSKDCFSCYNITKSNNCKYIENGGEICSDVYDGYGIGYEQSLGYEVVDTGVRSYTNLFTYVSHGNSYTYYSYCCYNSSHLFGCIGLRNKQYCIFNKQYSKEDYEILVGKIIRHMMQPRRDALVARPGESYVERGEFFHPSLSPFGYNETVAQEYYPLEYDINRRDALVARPQGMELPQDGRAESASLQIDYSAFGYHRSTYLAPAPQVDKVIKGSDVPDNIDDVTDDILKMAVLCEVSNKPFRITPQELLFYRKHHIPLPRKHPDVRHEERMKLRR